MKKEVNNKKPKKWENFLESNSLKTYIQEIDQYKVLTKEEEDKLAKRMASNNDQEAREKLIASNLRFVVSIAKNYLNKGIPFLDLINEGNMGLILACDKFDYTKGYRFISYAVWWIRQYIAKAFAEQVGLIRLPMNRALQHFKIKNLINDNDYNNQEGLSNTDIASKLDMKKDEVDTIITATKKYVSIDAPVNNDTSDRKTIFLEDVLLDTKNKLPEDEVLDKHLKETINNTLKILSDKERIIIRHRFGLNGAELLSLSEIGRKFNVTKERIRQIEKRAIKKLKQPSVNHHLKTFMAA